MVAVFSKKAKGENQKCVHRFGVRRGTRAFRYALPADETSPAIAVPRYANYIPVSYALTFPGVNCIFMVMPTERITYYTLLRKVGFPRDAPWEIPDNKTS